MLYRGEPWIQRTHHCTAFQSSLSAAVWIECEGNDKKKKKKKKKRERESARKRKEKEKKKIACVIFSQKSKALKELLKILTSVYLFIAMARLLILILV